MNELVSVIRDILIELQEMNSKLDKMNSKLDEIKGIGLFHSISDVYDNIDNLDSKLSDLVMHFIM